MPKSKIHVWSDGVPLWGAVERYSPPALWNEYQILTSDLFPQLPDEFDPAPISYAGPPLAEDPVKTYMVKSGRLAELEKQLKTWALESLTDGSLIALAFRLPRLRDSEPEWLQIEDWKAGTTDWINSGLAASGVTFADVRILPAKIQKTTKSAASSKPNAAPGRPSFKKIIIEAWEALVTADEIPKSGPVNSLFPKIRSKVHEMHRNIRPDSAGLGDSLLYDLISPLLSKLRAKQK